MLDYARKEGNYIGMFDTLDFRMDCPYCGETIRDFQTKDQYMPRMDILRPYQPVETKWVKKENQRFPLESIVLKRVTNWYTSHMCRALDDKALWIEWFVGEKGAHCEVEIERWKKEEEYLSTTGGWTVPPEDN